MARQYLTILFSIVLLFLAINLAPMLFFYQNGEYKSLDDAVLSQRISDKKIIYGTILGRSDPFEYKRKLVNIVHPEVVVLGGSTVLQFRERMFSVPMINAGQAMDTALEGLQFLPALRANKPEFVIIGIDFWWFSGKTHHRLESIDGLVVVPPRKKTQGSGLWALSKDEVDSGTMSLLDGFKFFRWWIEGAIDFDMLFGANNGDNSHHIGVSGRFRREGFGPEGSRYYTSRITGSRTLSKGDKIEEAFKHPWFGASKVINSTTVSNFLVLIQELEEADIRTILFFNPLPPTLVRLMENSGERYDWIASLKEQFRNRGLSFYDYNYDSTIGVDDCEFLDGRHGGEVTAMRILERLSRDNPKIMGYIDRPYIEASIDRYSGNAFVIDREITEAKEVDFLGIGCKKI